MTSDRHHAIQYAVGALSVLAIEAEGEMKPRLTEIVERLQAMLKEQSSANRPTISAGGAYELKLYGTPGYVGTVAGITVHADPDVPEHTVLVKDELGRELGRIINVGKYVGEKS